MSSSSDPEADAEPTSPSAAGAGADLGQRRPRYKRRKVAILLGYYGAGYQGMQKNPGARTIEGDLEEALYQAGAVPEADRGAPQRYDWARATRTDKGVSAAGQVVSGRFYVDPPGFVDRLNTQLAPQIRCWEIRHPFSSRRLRVLGCHPILIVEGIHRCNLAASIARKEKPGEGRRSRLASRIDLFLPAASGILVGGPIDDGSLAPVPESDRGQPYPWSQITALHRPHAPQVQTLQHIITQRKLTEE
ncbi:hypothetical protein U9M48_030856 [Paspalum notatum var. saurae]|uniref:Pseudouridine synthase I TruA alpha/beta domain-containing protein n=1 Tax=Paspalum notatum var. saurae TaxID=547442 RepID=A0AAQ3U2G0_PASNO